MLFIEQDENCKCIQNNIWVKLLKLFKLFFKFNGRIYNLIFFRIIYNTLCLCSRRFMLYTLCTQTNQYIHKYIQHILILTFCSYINLIRSFACTSEEVAQYGTVVSRIIFNKGMLLVTIHIILIRDNNKDIEIGRLGGLPTSSWVL